MQNLFVYGKGKFFKLKSSTLPTAGITGVQRSARSVHGVCGEAGEVLNASSLSG